MVQRVRSYVEKNKGLHLYSRFSDKSFKVFVVEVSFELVWIQQLVNINEKIEFQDQKKQVSDVHTRSQVFQNVHF